MGVARCLVEINTNNCDLWCQVHFRQINDPMVNKSIFVLEKHSMASLGLHTIGSFSLKLVFNITGIPVILSNVLIRLWNSGFDLFETL